MGMLALFSTEVIENPGGWSLMRGGEGMDAWQSFLPSEVAEAFVLARNAFDVMMRRGWGVSQFPDDTWMAIEDRDGSIIEIKRNIKGYGDPFQALVEADKWYKEKIEK